MKLPRTPDLPLAGEVELKFRTNLLLKTTVPAEDAQPRDYLVRIASALL